jgi:hypothetical protein
VVVGRAASFLVPLLCGLGLPLLRPSLLPGSAMSLIHIAVVRVFLALTTGVITMPWWVEGLTGAGTILTTSFGVLGYVFAGLIVYATSKHD